MADVLDALTPGGTDARGWQRRLEAWAESVRWVHDILAAAWVWVLTQIVGAVMILLFNEWAKRGIITDGGVERLRIVFDMIAGIATVGLFLLLASLILSIGASAIEDYQERDGL